MTLIDCLKGNGRFLIKRLSREYYPSVWHLTDRQWPVKGMSVIGGFKTAMAAFHHAKHLENKDVS